MSQRLHPDVAKALAQQGVDLKVGDLVTWSDEAIVAKKNIKGINAGQVINFALTPGASKKKSDAKLFVCVQFYLKAQPDLVAPQWLRRVDGVAQKL